MGSHQSPFRSSPPSRSVLRNLLFEVPPTLLVLHSEKQWQGFDYQPELWQQAFAHPSRVPLVKLAEVYPLQEPSIEHYLHCSNHSPPRLPLQSLTWSPISSSRRWWSLTRMELWFASTRCGTLGVSSLLRLSFKTSLQTKPNIMKHKLNNTS